MKTRSIKTEFNRGGYAFRQIERSGSVAIYEQRRRETGRVIAFEVVRIKTIRPNPAWEAHRGFDAVEICPASEQWGGDGFTARTLSEARKRAALFNQP